jgi:hypothetical protein
MTHFARRAARDSFWALALRVLEVAVCLGPIPRVDGAAGSAPGAWDEVEMSLTQNCHKNQKKGNHQQHASARTEKQRTKYSPQP